MKQIKVFVRRITDLFSRQSLIRKLFVCYVCIMVMPTIVYGRIYFISSEKKIISESAQQAYAHVDSVFESIRGNYETLIVSSRIIITNADFMDIALRFDDLAIEKLLDFKNNLWRTLANMMAVNSELRIFRVYTERSQNIEAWPVIYSAGRIRDVPVYQQDSLNFFWDISHRDYGNSALVYNPEQYVSLCKRISALNTPNGGFVEVGMTTENFFGDLFSGTTQEQTICIVDKTGKLIINTQNYLIKNLYSHKCDVKGILAANTRQFTGSFSFSCGARNYLVAYKYNNTTQSYIYSFISNENMIALLDNNRNLVGWLVASTVLGLSLVTYLITRALMRKILLLKSYMNDVQAGNMNAEPIDLGWDEIGQLAQVFNDTVSSVNNLFKVVVEDEQNLRKFEARLLQSQINWHFTYNTLEAMEMTAVVKGDNEMADTISAFGKLLRYSVDRKTIYLTLQEELRYVRNYIMLVNMQKDYKISFSVIADQELLQVRVLRMLLQPAVENSVYHGILYHKRDGRITLSAYVEEGTFWIDLVDDGAGISQEQLDAINNRFTRESDTSMTDEHIGLVNVDRRIKTHFGGQYGLTLESDSCTYTKVRFTLPYELMDDSGSV